MHTRTEIRYLGDVVAATGVVHTGDVRQIGGRMAPVDERGWTIEMRSVPPTVVDHEPLPVAVSCGWGDRTGGIDGPLLAVWTEPDGDGLAVSAGPSSRVRVTRGGYDTDERPAWIDAFARVVEAVRNAHARDVAERVDVGSVCAAYAAILARIDREHEAHYRQWSIDVQRIARRFRRARVEVGEQTVPGKCVVRSSRGKTLGYANVWDGRWLGTVEVVR